MSDASLHDDRPEITITLSVDSDHDDHFLMDTSNDLTYHHDQYKLLHNRSQQKGKGNWEKQCNTCSNWIDLRNIEIGESALTNHERDRWCLAKVASTQHALELSATAAALEDLQHSEVSHHDTCPSWSVPSLLCIVHSILHFFICFRNLSIYRWFSVCWSTLNCLDLWPLLQITVLVSL